MKFQLKNIPLVINISKDFLNCRIWAFSIFSTAWDEFNTCTELTLSGLESEKPQGRQRILGRDVCRTRPAEWQQLATTETSHTQNCQRNRRNGLTIPQCSCHNNSPFSILARMCVLNSLQVTM